LIEVKVCCIYSDMTRKAQTKREDVTKVSINFPKNLWKDLKRHALEDEETVTDILVRPAESYVSGKRKRR
jgi:hypothetical protein